MAPLNLEAWWDEPEYKPCNTLHRGMFILQKLREHDPAKFRDVMTDLYRDDQPDPEDIGTFEWQTILAFMGASGEEIKDVQMRMGRPWLGREGNGGPGNLYVSVLPEWIDNNAHMNMGYY